MTYKPLYATQEDEEDKKKKGYQPLFYKEEEKAEPKPTKVSRPPIDEANTSLLVRKDVKKVGDTYQKKTDEDLKKEKEQELMQRGDKLEQSEKKDTSTTKEAVIESFNAHYNLERKKQQEVNIEESIKSGKADVYGDVAEFKKMTYRAGASALVGKVLGETNPLGIAGQMITSNLVGQQDFKEKQIIRDSRNMPIGYKEPGELGQLRDGILTGIINLESSPFFAVELIGLKTDSPRLAEWGAKMADGYKATLVAHPEWARPEDLTLVEAVKSRDIRQISKWSFRTVGELLPNMVGSMAAAVGGTLAGGPAGGAVASLGFAALQEGGSAYDSMIEDGIVPDIAAHWAGIYGAIAGVLESLSETNVINKAFRSVESKAINQIVNRSFLQNFRRNLPKYIIEYGKAQILEGSTEVAQQFTQNVIVNWLDDTQSLTEGLVESFAAGFLGSGATFGIASTGVDIYNDAKALQTLKRLEAIAPKPPDPPGGTLAEKAEANANAKLDTLEAQERVTGVVEQPTVAEPVTDQIVPERTPAPVQNFPEVDTTTVEQFKSAVTETKEEMSKLPIAELRDRVDNIDKLEWNELSEEIKRFSWAMKDALREMIDAKKESVFVMPPVKKNNIINTIELEIVDYEDGTFGLRTATSLPTMGSASPMSGKFVSRELAIKQGVIDIFRRLEEGVRDTSNKNNVLVAQQAIKRLTAFAQSQGFTDIAPELPPEPKVAKKKQPEKKQVKTEFTGKQIGKEAKELGSDGGISDSLIKQIQAENYVIEEAKIADLRKSDPDLDDYLKSGEIREFEGEEFAMNPIVNSKGEVLDGYNRIAQTLANGDDTISILRGVATEKESISVEEALLAMAKAYKTADEFVESRINAYHGTDKKFDEFSKDYIGENQPSDYGEGLYFTDSKEVAKSFAEDAGGDIVMPVFIDIMNPARNKDLQDKDIQLAIDDEMGFKDMGEVLAEKGFDGIEFTHSDGSKEFVIYDVDQVRTEAQLRDIWKKANPLTKAEKSATNEVYDDDKSRRSDTKRGTLPDTVRDGEERSGVDTEAIEVSSEPVARGEAPERRTSVGERFGSQYELNLFVEDLVKKNGTDRSKYTDDELALLKRYTGAGGIEKEGAEGRGLLDEYYTPKEVVNLLWWKIKDLIPTEAKILEPSMGIGSFVEYAPSRDYSFNGNEINPTSAAISQILYKNVEDVSTQPFEDIFIDSRGNARAYDDTVYDAIIGNPPYGKHRGVYKGLGEEVKIPEYSEYFLKRSMDLVKDDGVVAMVVPSGFLRNGPSYAKFEIAKLGSLIDAYRLPNGAFATTDIGTDIVILKKTAEGNVEQRAKEMANDTFFKENPEKILGEVSERKGRFGLEQFVKGDKENIEAEIKGAQYNAQNEQEQDWEENHADTVADLYDETTALTRELETAPKAKKAEIKEKIAEAENKMAKIEDDFIEKHTSNLENTTAEDPMNEEVAKPEPTQEKKLKKKRPDANSKVVLEPRVEGVTFQELKTEMSQEEIDTFLHSTVTGELEPSYLNSLSDEKKLELANYMNGEWYSNFNYFQGNIYDKMDALEVNKDEMTKEQYEKQKRGLEAVLPPQQVVQRMSFTPHAPFMRDTVIPYTYGEDERQETEDMTLQEAFKQFLSSLPREAFGRSSQWEIRGYIDNKVVSGGTKEQNAEERIRRREIGDRLLRKFLSEGLDEKAVKVVEDTYNRQFNAVHIPDFRKVPLFGKINDVFHNDKLELLPVQRQGIGFLVNKGVGLLAHDVGVGKTMQAIVAINETMERGWSKKPLIIVPPSVYRQFTNEIIDILPHRKVNQLGSLGADFKGDLANLEIEDGSISIITYEGFKRLGFSDETYDSLMENVEDVIGDQDEKKTKRAKELEKAKISEMIGKGKRKTMTEVSFEDLGFDLVTMDEVHNANHIVAKAKPKDKEGRQSGDFRSFQIQPSDLGVKMWLASNYILKNNNGRNVYLLSATPFTNHPMEYYSILSLMGMERLRKMGLQNVNEFIQTFMDLQTQGELTVTNEYKEKTQVRGFNNYQQFVKLLTEFIDFREGEEAGVIRPERLTNNVVLNPTPEQAEQIQRVHELWENPKDEAAKKARIGLIGRLLEITFSPYASGHFYEGARPDYKQFVNGSPKIKAAMEMIKQNKKDDPDANQLIYSSVGNEFFPDIREYLIREVGFKPSEVAIIQGSTPKQKRSEIASAFNQGKIKVIIGSSAISEGMNLQKRTTDLYMLSMPWNYTDLRQIRGRIHRQGNDYKRVRIHNLFISDSVDGFLSQKLEVKEKRYEESLKFKEDYLDIGDVPFEEMKFDLVKDAVKRVRIESELTDKQLRRQLDAANGDLGMVKRKMEKLADLEERLRQERNDLDRTKDYLKDEPDDEFWQSRYQDIKKNVTSLESKIVKARAEYAEKGIDITELDKKQAVVDELESKLESLRSDMSAKLEVAEAQRAEMQTVEVAKNDYKKIADDLKAQNKTFFELTPTAKTERAKGKKLKGGSAGASVGSFKDNTPVLLGGMEHISPIALPELVDLARELTGKVPELNSRLRTSRGKFQGSILGSEIQLRPDMFTEENQGDVAKVLAHEIGHAIDFIPDSESSRGNLIGRLKSLRKYLKGTFGEELDNKTLKNELWNMSLYWRPIEGYIEGQSNGVATDSFIKYRKSSSELYADAISMLLNSPGLLEQMAPTFYNSFFENLDAKPEAKIAFFELQELINQGAEAVNKQRLAKIYDMYNKADLKAKEIEQIKQEEKKKRKRGLFETFKQDIMTVNQPFEDRVKILKKRGENISPDMNPVYALDERNYLGGLVKARIEKDFEPIKNTIEENGMTWSDLGVLLMLERILYGDRGEVANPGGFQPEFAQEIYDDIGTVEKQADEAKQNIGSLKERLGAENFAVLQEQAKEYRSKLKQVFMEGYEAGLYSEDLKTLFDSNEFYVPFKVQEYMQQKASYSVKQKKGTLKDIENPANSGLEKVMAVLRSIEQNKAKDKSITFLKQNFAEDVVVAETRTVNGKPEALPPNKDKYPGKELVMVMEKGKPQGYYVDKYIAISLQNQTVGQTNALIKVLSFLNSRWFRPVFVCFNVGFQTFNTIRDFKRFWKNIPNMTMARAFKLYAKAIPDAYARGFNKKSAIISEMQSNKMLSVSFTDMIYETEEDAQVDIILKKLGLKENEKQTPAVLKPFSVILDFIGNVGTLVETVPKVAAYMHLTEGGMDMAEIGDLVRRKAGSPDFLAKGLYTPATNNIFLFSNAIIQGIRSDVETAVSPSTASGFWYKTSKTVFLPKMLMLAAMMGLFGVWMKEWAEGVTEYDKTNYTAIPLGIDENGKSWYLRIPEDETGRFIGAIFWKFANGLRNDQNMEKDLKDIVSLWGGQLPSVTPAITVFKDLLNFSAGANIYDSFRQRMVLSEQEQKAGGMAALKPFLTYEFNQLGGNVFVKMYSNEKNLTTTEKALRLPIVSNIIGRFIRATDYGKTESIRGISDKIQSERAKKSLGDRKLAEKYANQTPDNAMFGEKTRMEREMIMEAIGHMPITTEEKKRATSLKTRYRFYTTKQAGDVYVDQLLYAESVQEQKAILKKVKNIKSEAEFNEFKNFLRREKVVSAETLGTFER